MNTPESALVTTEVNNALQSGQSANIARFRHRWIVEGLHACVHGEKWSETTRERVGVRWGDGTAGARFPVHCRPFPASPGERDRRLRVGLNSGRHPALDRWVAFYVLRNREVEEAESQAEQEELAWRGGMDLLGDEALDGKIVEIFQTGLEPLVVGFFRAVVDAASQREKVRRKPLLVVPQVWVPAQVTPRARPELVAQACAAHPDLLAQVQGAGGTLTLHWRPERPMIEEELDDLTKEFPRLNGDLGKLQKKSAFLTLLAWG